MQKAEVKGFIKATSSETQHPLQTRVQLILTDFLPNGNHMGVPIEEKQNILTSALYMPLKINFTGDGFTDHADAIPLGPIVSVYEGKDEDRDVIYAEAIVWDEMYTDVSKHLKDVFIEGIGTSWEIFYDKKQSTTDANGVLWLKDCVFAGTCVVDVPAYGPNRTRVLAIAEALNKHESEQMTLQSTEVEKEKDHAESANTTTDISETLYDANDLLFQIWDGLDQLYNQVYDLQAVESEKNLATIAQSFADKVKKVTDGIGTLKTNLGVAQQLAETTETAKAALEVQNQTLTTERDTQVRLTERIRTLAQSGIVYSDEDFESKSKTLASMDDTTFKMYVGDLVVVKSGLTNESAKAALIKIPETMGTGEIDIKTLSKAMKNK